MKPAIVAMLALPGAMLAGCATIVDGSSQTIAIATPPTTGATCVLTNGAGRWTLTSPGVVTVDKSPDALKAVCSKPGWRTGAASIPARFDAWTVADMVTPPVVGIGLDVASGAIDKYPDSAQVPMEPGGAAPPGR